MGVAQIDKMIEYAMERNRRFFEDGEKNVFAANCDILTNMLDNCDLRVKPHDRFFVGVNVGGLYGRVLDERISVYDGILDENGLQKGVSAFAYSGGMDLGHTSAEWESVISLGIYGLRQRIEDYRDKCGEKEKAFFDGAAMVYDAALRFMKRCADFARENGMGEMSESLYRLTHRPPETLYEAMQTSLLFYSLHRYFDRSDPRSMGRVDSLFYPYFLGEERERARGLVRDYITALNGFNTVANLPFALGGTRVGESLVSELSYMFLEEYRKMRPDEVKLHILVGDRTPEDFLALAMESIREGSNSIVFLSDKKVVESLIRLGERREDAERYYAVGCYECGGFEELACTCSARVNIPKALEYALFDGVDLTTGERIGLRVENAPRDFAELKNEFYRQLGNLCKCAMKATDLWEAKYKMIHAAPILSATYEAALEKGGDLYCDSSARYNNSSLNAMGLATAADSLCAIRKLVFEDKRYTLAELCEILRADWSGNEPLRLYCKNKLPKFGNGDPVVDSVAAEIVEALDSFVSGKPNVKGGVYRLGLFSIDQRWSLGKHTAASADGRWAGETLSQNTGATFGCDREGTTAHLLSVTALDAGRTPNGSIVDIDLHSSAVEGENGLSALLATLHTYIEMGGFAVHYNVLNTEVLKDAVKYPDRYPNLQVRLCGWNVLFSSLSDREKEEFIRRSERA